MRVALGVVGLMAAVGGSVLAASQLSGDQNDPEVENSNSVESLVPASAEDQTVRLDGVAQMLVSVAADGSIQTLVDRVEG